MAGCLLLWPPPSPTKGRNLFITQWTLRISHPTTNWTTTQKGKPWSFRPQLTIFNMEMETNWKRLEPMTRKTLHCQKCIPIGHVGPGFFWLVWYHKLDMRWLERWHIGHLIHNNTPKGVVFEGQIIRCQSKLMGKLSTCYLNGEGLLNYKRLIHANSLIMACSKKCRQGSRLTQTNGKKFHMLP